MGDEESSEVSNLEAAVRDSLRDVADMQDQGKEDVRFSRDAVGKLEASRGVGSGSLWGVVELWKNFLDARAQAAGRRVQQDVQNRLIKYLSGKNGGSGDKQLPSRSTCRNCRRTCREMSGRCGIASWKMWG